MINFRVKKTEIAVLQQKSVKWVNIRQEQHFEPQDSAQKRFWCQQKFDEKIAHFAPQRQYRSFCEVLIISSKALSS